MKSLDPEERTRLQTAIAEGQQAREQQETHAELGPSLRRRGHAQAAPGEQAPRQEDHARMADPPAHAERRGRSQTRVAADESAHGDHVIHFERVHRSEGEGGRVRGPEVAHGSLSGGS